MPTFAAVDVGSNSVRLKIARLVRGRLQSIHEDREVTRLGESVFRSGMLDPNAIAHTVKVLRRFQRATTELGADAVRVVATSAMRDTRNAVSFLEWVRSATGWRVEIISGLEEGRLIHFGVIANTRINRWPLLLIDLGGGSCELTVSEEGEIRSMVSLSLGAVRLTEEFVQSDPPKVKELDRMRQFIAEEVGRIEQRMRNRGVQLTIATSGTAETLAALAKNFGDNRKKDFAPRPVIRRIVQELASRNLVQRRALPGLGPKRAEIIVAGATVYAELMERFDLPGFTFSRLGLRDGLLAQMSAEFDQSTALGRRVKNEREHGIMEAVAHYGAELHFAEHVRELVLELFRQLKSIHRLPPEYQDWLAAAAMLHEVGSFINRAGRHRHAYYLISNSEIYGFNVEQRRLIAAICRYMGKSKPGDQDQALRGLSLKDRQLLPRAVVLLRLARSLNLGRKGGVTGVRARLRDSQVTLEIEAKRTGADLELWSLLKERSYFREVFGRELDAKVV
jgi:exopolyphosphatase / guanosine-5'-triphosphate,3'-diphosphate pyrophosphatase